MIRTGSDENDSKLFRIVFQSVQIDPKRAIIESMEN